MSTIMPSQAGGPGAMGPIHRLHFVGIGGAGMGGIAEVLLNLGYPVSGSDLRENAVVDHLRGLGADIHIGHHGEHVRDADAVVISSAVTEDNPEVVAARAARVPVVPRAEMLAELMRFRFGIAVAGTHGKTTTTSLVASILAEADLDPTFVIGGRLNSAASHARLGAGRYLVAEADESDASFLYLNPMLAVVTNIDADHLDTYGGDFDRLRATFVEFLHHLPFYGLAVLCDEDAELRALAAELGRPARTYGFSPGADLQATEVVADAGRSHFTVCAAGMDPLPVSLNLPGRHNVLNALGAIAVARALDVPDAAIQRALSGFSGIGRRFQQLGRLPVGKGSALLMDDYAHHPREIEAVTEALRSNWPDRRLVVVFQPHRFSRTRDLFDDFARVLGEVDLLLVTEVYGAGEPAVTGADARSLCRAIRLRGQVDPVFVGSLDELVSILPDMLRPEDVVITLGAGSIGTALPRLLAGETAS
ncbi:UDP-N-acetylmuramate--L-alanine ligase [Spiribacter vilamensis]|uniref:UDP-N-acetylmuramate--L-alanine ligase n=1 Tax=Spiribacter vilamensis TaxID=531306 RepID=A0A4Q8CY92_9GAMM|nr:UDP-N-acetylmuramate--L-alanine ligase [Spiribacter vilamensis]RZU97914.1 UDP-N-acetylmuramate--L-alanine ligase [Spiribacter vilamensis]